MHLARTEIDADMQVEDDLNIINWRELDSIVLVGHSYGGLIITGIAGSVSEKIRGGSNLTPQHPYGAEQIVGVLDGI